MEEEIVCNRWRDHRTVEQLLTVENRTHLSIPRLMLFLCHGYKLINEVSNVGSLFKYDSEPTFWHRIWKQHMTKERVNRRTVHEEAAVNLSFSLPKLNQNRAYVEISLGHGSWFTIGNAFKDVSWMWSEPWIAFSNQLRNKQERYQRSLSPDGLEHEWWLASKIKEKQERR